MMALSGRFMCHPDTIAVLRSRSSAATRLIYHVFDGLQIGTCIILAYAHNPAHQATFIRDQLIPVGPFKSALRVVLKVLLEAQGYIAGTGTSTPYTPLCISAGYGPSDLTDTPGTASKRKTAPPASDAESEDDRDTRRKSAGGKSKRSRAPTFANSYNADAPQESSRTEGYLKWKGKGLFPIPKGNGRNAVCMANALVGSRCSRGIHECPRNHLHYTMLPQKIAAAVATCVADNANLILVPKEGTKIPKKKRPTAPVAASSDSDDE